MPRMIAHAQDAPPDPRMGQPVLPAKGKRWDAHEALEGAGVLYVGRQVASPWEPSHPGTANKPRRPGRQLPPNLWAHPDRTLRALPGQARCPLSVREPGNSAPAAAL